MTEEGTSSGASSPPGNPVGAALLDALSTATGVAHRPDPIIERTGGPAGNARLTAWAGLIVLAFFVAEGVTLISVGHLITAHILIGTFLVPLVLLKTATTAWRILRYYQGAPAYRTAGPPPILLRVLGPLVVVTGLAVLGSGLALIALGQSTYSTIVTVLGFQVSALTIHKASFVAWLAATGLHVLVRTVPALKVVRASPPHDKRVPGGRRRLVILAMTLAVGVVAAVVVVHLSGDWTHHRFGELHDKFGVHGRGDG